MVRRISVTSFLVKGLPGLNSGKEGSKGNLSNRLRSELTGQALSRAEAIDSVTLFRKGSVLDEGRVSSR